MKRFVDIVGSAIGLVVMSPVLLPVLLITYLYDRHSPFYVAPRVGKNFRLFQMIKLRSMVHGADKSGVDSTGSNDPRITPVGRFIRAYKLDEFAQLINVLKGDMSLVGPRPNVKRETDLYTETEKGLLKVKPGITDFASIVFSDENDILKHERDPDIAYNQLIRPWKSRLGLLYVEKQGLFLDLRLIVLTILAVLSRERALLALKKVLVKLNVEEDLVRLSARTEKLTPTPPPGSDQIVLSRG